MLATVLNQLEDGIDTSIVAGGNWMYVGGERCGSLKSLFGFV
jgi:hypothetical protein